MRFVERAVLAMLCGASMGAVMVVGGRLSAPVCAQADGPAAAPALLRARRVELVDASGRARAILALDAQETAGLSLCDAAGSERARLSVTKAGTPELTLAETAPPATRTGTSTAPAPLTSDGRAGGESPLVLLESALAHDELSSAITGTVRNPSGQTLRAVSVEFTLFDAAGHVLGTTNASTARLLAGDVWKFRAIVNVRGVARCALKTLRGTPEQ
jgi:hypothetical protein